MSRAVNLYFIEEHLANSTPFSLVLLFFFSSVSLTSPLLFIKSFRDDWEWNADGDTFWDGDDNYWAGDDELAYAPVDGSSDKGRMNDGAGSIFINAMQSIVYLVGLIFCSGGLFVGYTVQDRQLPLNFPLSNDAESLEMMIPKKSSRRHPDHP